MEIGEELAAPLDTFQIARHVQGLGHQDPGPHVGPEPFGYAAPVKSPGGQVDVVGERQGRQPHLERPGAGAFHVATGGVPGPLAVDVPVLRQREHQEKLPQAGAITSGPSRWLWKQSGPKGYLTLFVTSAPITRNERC